MLKLAACSLILVACSPSSTTSVDGDGGPVGGGRDGGAASASDSAVGPPDPGVWLGTVQLGTDNNDAVYGALIDDHGAVTVFGARAVPGASLWFAARLSPSGRELWRTSWNQGGPHRGVVGPNGELYIGGEGGLSRLSDSGEVMWTFKDALVLDLAIGPDGDVYITGAMSGTFTVEDGILPPIGDLGGTYDAYVLRLSPDGKVKTRLQIGTSERDWAYGIAVGAGGEVYIAGPTQGRLPAALTDGPPGSANGFLMRLSAEGKVVWTKQFADLLPIALRMSGGDIFLGGGSIARYQPNSVRKWITPLPTLPTNDMIVDHSGRPWVVGATKDSNVGYAAVFDGDGAHVATRFFPASPTSGPTTDPETGDLWPRAQSTAWGLSEDASGNMYVMGETNGDIGENLNRSSLAVESFPGTDGFVAKLDPDGVLEGVTVTAAPAELSLAAGGSATVTATTRDAHGATLTSTPVWASSASEVATVDGGGAVLGLAKGRAYLTPSWDRVVGSPAAVHVGEDVGTVLFGTPHGDVAKAVAVDGDAILVGGWTDDAFDGQTFLGARDAFVARLGARGTRAWLAQTGGGGEDSVEDLATDAAGNSYALMVTTTPLPGGEFQATVVASDDRAGARRWSFDPGPGVLLTALTVDGDGNVFVTGVAGAGQRSSTIIKLTSSGSEVWRYVTDPAYFGFILVNATAIAVAPNGDIVIAGAKDENQFLHAFVLAVDPTGTILRWSSNQNLARVHALVADAAGNLYVSGAHDNGMINDNSGPYRGMAGYVARLTPTGTLVWRNLIGIDDGIRANIMVSDLAVDAAGNVYGAGAIEGTMALEGTPAGASDAIAFRLDPATGALVWKRQLGTSDSEYGTSIAVKPNGDVVLVGYTFGRLGGGSLRGVTPRKVNSDVFVTVFAPDGTSR